MIHRKAVNNKKLLNKQHKKRNYRQSGGSQEKLQLSYMRNGQNRQKEYENKRKNDLKLMRNASFLGINDGNSMRNTILCLISHTVMLLIHRLLSGVL